MLRIFNVINLNLKGTRAAYGNASIRFENITRSYRVDARHYEELSLLLQSSQSSLALKPNYQVLCAILKSCAALIAINFGKSLHGYVVKQGHLSCQSISKALLNMYAKCGVLGDCKMLFGQIGSSDPVIWNIVLSGFSASRNYDAEVIRLFHEMCLGGKPKPTSVTIATILPVCARLADLDVGKSVHSYVIKSGLMTDVLVGNALISMYSKCGLVSADAYAVFNGIIDKDVISWNAMIAGLAENRFIHDAYKLFSWMLKGPVEPNCATIANVLPICASLDKNTAYCAGREIHCYVLRRNELAADVTVFNALVSFHLQLGRMEEAESLFHRMKSRDLVSWNAIIAGYASNGEWSKALDLFHKLLSLQTIGPDSVTIVSILPACAQLQNLEVGKKIHGYILRHCSLFEATTVGNAMRLAYVSCGSLDEAYKIFNRMSETDLTTWNLMVRAYAENGFTAEALSVFRELQTQGMKPDAMTFMSLLPVSSQMASVHLLRQCHGYVVRACLSDLCLKGALLDMYAKCGAIVCAYKLFQSSPDKDLVMFTAMVGGLAMHGRGEEALRVFSHMLDLGVKPDNVVITAVLSACSHAGLVNEGLKIFNSIEEVHGVKPTMEQYACVVDLLARGGKIEDAFSFVSRMPIEANASIWGTLLGACRTHCKVELGRVVADHLFKNEANNIGNYVVMSNLYAAEARWDGVMEVRKLMKTRDLTKPAGCSWIEVERRKNIFIAGDWSHPERSVIYSTLSALDQQIKEPV